MEITARKLHEVTGMSLRKAYYVLGGLAKMRPEEAARAEEATGVHRLHWLYPDQYDKAGRALASRPDSTSPPFITHDARTLTTTCQSCGAVLIGHALDSQACRDFVDLHSRCSNPYPAMRKEQSAEAEVGA